MLRRSTKEARKEEWGRCVPFVSLWPFANILPFPFIEHSFLPHYAEFLATRYRMSPPTPCYRPPCGHFILCPTQLFANLSDIISQPLSTIYRLNLLLLFYLCTVHPFLFATSNDIEFVCIRYAPCEVTWAGFHPSTYLGSTNTMRSPPPC